METPELSYRKRLWLLFYTFAKIASLVVGGGLAMLPVIEETFVERHGMLTREELLEMVAMSQTVPGIIAVNSAVYIGMKVAGIGGALAAALGAVLPSFVVIVVIAAFFPHLNPSNKYLLGAFAGVRACVTGLILVTAYKMARKTLANAFDLSIAAIFLILVLAGVNPAILILASMPLGCVWLYVSVKRCRRAVK